MIKTKRQRSVISAKFRVDMQLRLGPLQDSWGLGNDALGRQLYRGPLWWPLARFNVTEIHGRQLAV